MNRKTFLSALFMTTVGFGLPKTIAHNPFSMPEKEIKDRLTKILKQLLSPKYNWQKFSWEAQFVRDLDMDSLDAVEFIMAIEKEFSISIPDEIAERLNLLPKVIAYLKKVVK